MDYSLRELECFTAAAEELSFTRAAEKLHLAQPPLSRHIRSLEEKIGTPLFERRARSVALTPAGALFHEETRQLLPQLARAGENARRSASGEVARLRIGFVSAVLSPEMMEVLRRFRDAHPSIQLIVQDSPPAEQITAMTRGELDGGFIGLAPVDRVPGLHLVRWKKEPVRCFVPAGHRFATRTSVALRELAKEAFVAVSSESAPAFALYVRQLCRNAGFRPRILFTSPRAQAVAVMVAAGAGIALLPDSLKRIAGQAVAPLALEGSPSISHVFARRSGPVVGPMREFVRMLV